jgi:hypothetical protein
VNGWYPLAKQAMGCALVDLEDDDVRLQLVSTDAVFDAGDEFLDDLGATLLGTAQAIADRSMVGREWRTTTATVEVDDVADGDEVQGWVLYVHTGTASTSRLLVWVDTTPWGSSQGTSFEGGPEADGSPFEVQLQTVLAKI